MRLISFDLYWKYNNENINELVKLIINKQFHFFPKELIYQEDNSFEDGIKEFAQIDFDTEDTVSVIIRNNQRERIYFNVEKWGKHKLIKIAISCFIKSAFETEFINQYLIVSDLICCFIYDTEDERWQTEEKINQYELNCVDYLNLKKVKDRAGRTIIDTSRNAGRSKHSIGIKFLAAGEMYFGNIFFKIISQDILLNIKNSNSVQIGGNNLIQIKLFNIPGEDEKNMREQQGYFLANTNLLEVANNLHEKYRGIDMALNAIGI